MKRESIERLANQLQLIAKALKEKRPTQHWGEGARMNYRTMLRGVGLTLISANQVKKQGYRLRRGAQPVVTTYYGAPIQTDCGLYVREIQCVYVGPRPSPAATAAPDRR